MRDALAWRDDLAQLLPPGKAWPRDAGSALGQMLHGLAEEFARLDGRAAVLPDEADPLSALELLPDWERVAGLPDACVPIPEGIRDRQIAVARKISGLGGQTRGFFVDLAERLGVEVEIEEFVPAMCGVALCGDHCFSDAWRFVWRVRIVADSQSSGSATRLRFAWALAGLASAGDPIRSFGIESLECLLRRAAPAHTTVLFAYPDDPEPALWFDFTEQDGV